jgi:hypothetical protein
MTTEELFKCAGKIGGALWLWIVLNENARGGSDREGWVPSLPGRAWCPDCLAGMLGTDIETVEKWSDRLESQGFVKCEMTSIVRDDHPHDHSGSVAWLFWVRKDARSLLGFIPTDTSKFRN